MPLLWISLSFLTGLVLGRASPWGGWLPLALSLMVLSIGVRRLRGRARLPGALVRLGDAHPALRVAPLVLAAALSLGAGRMGQALTVAPDSPAARLNEQGAFRLRGVVIEPPDRREDSTRLRLRLESATRLDEEGRLGEPLPVRGLVLALLGPRVPWEYGDRLELDGSPETPTGASENRDFSYRDYLARQGISSILRAPRVRRVGQGAGSPLLAAVFGLREAAHRQLYRLFPSPEAPLLAGILLGIESGLPPDLSKAFQDTGTAHIIAISGFNIAILASLFSLLLGGLLGGYISRWWVLALTLLAVAGYTVLAGAGASVVRAAIMGCLALLGAQLGRRSTGAAGLNTLSFTAAVMCLFNPLLPWDASFQLSFAATLGLMLYASPLQEGFTRLAALRLPLPLARRLAGPVGEYLLFTLAAQVTTLPVILYHFRRLSLSALVVNPLVLPAQPLVMVLSGAAVLAGLVLAPLGQALGWLALPLTTYTIRVIEAFGGPRGGVVLLSGMEPAAAALLFAALTLPAVAASLSAAVLRWIRDRLTPLVVLTGLGLLAALLARAALAAPDGRLRLTVFEGGGLPAVLVEAPDGRRVLIDGGTSANRLGADLDRRFSPLDRRIDALVIASCDSGTFETLTALVERFPVGEAWFACAPHEGRAAENLFEALDEARVESRALHPGERLLVGGAVTVELVAEEEAGAALRVTWMDFRALLPGGISPGRLGEEAQGPGVLVLPPPALERADFLLWDESGVQAVVAPPAKPGLDLPDRWLRLSPWGWLEVTTDGAQMWLQISPD